MKKSLIALAAFAVVGAASAQSSVTLSGVIDAGIVNPLGADKTRIDQSGNGANQIVFAGTEDLGGGLKANFRLAQRFNPTSGLNDGSAGNRPTFQGESTVGLSGGFGAVRIGRALTAVQGPINSTDPWGTYQQGSTAVLAAGYSTDVDNVASSGSGLGRTDAVHYSSPTFSGFTGSVSYGFKDSKSTGTVQTGTRNFTSLWGSYVNGPLMVGGGQEQNRTGDKLTALLATYDFSVVKIGAGYSTVKATAANSNRKAYNLMVTAPVGAFTLKAAYGRSVTDGAAVLTTANAIKKAGIGADYALSKRTILYTSIGRDTVRTSDRSGFDIGVRHNF